MPKILKLISIILFFFSLLPAAFSQTDSTDSIRIVTYYPSPFGTYRELRTKRLAIGDDYIKTGAPPDKYDWQEYATDPMHNIGYDADLVVQGNVGIGTTAPINKLTVAGDFGIQGNSEYSHGEYGDSFRFFKNDRDFIFENTDGDDLSPDDDFVFVNTGVDGVPEPAITIKGSGNVGIGTTDPQAKLHIGGAPGPTNGIKFPDGSMQTSAAYLYVRDEKASGTDGGSAVSGTQTRTLNTAINNTISGASVGSNRITLPAGTYRIYANATAAEYGDANNPLRHKIRFRNITDNVTTSVGSSEICAYYTSSHSFINGAKFTIAGQKVFELQHYFSRGQATNGLGYATASGEVEVYAEVLIVKE